MARSLELLCALEQEISDTGKADDVCRGSYITGAEHFVCHSYKAKEGGMNTSHTLRSHVQNSSTDQRKRKESRQAGNQYSDLCCRRIYMQLKQKGMALINDNRLHVCLLLLRWL